MAALMDIKAEHGDEESAIIPQNEQSEVKQRFKSYRKKYRKMKIQFDDQMEEATQLFLSENTAWEIAKRIQEQNDQLMEIIVDMNNALNTPANFRYDILSPSINAVPELEADRPSAAARESTRDARTLVTLCTTVPHTPLDVVDTDKLPPELMDLENALIPGYLTLQHEEEYLAALDTNLASVTPGDEVIIPGTHLLSQPKDKIVPTERDFAIHHPSSVYNWLRVHQPQVFETKDEEKDTAPIKSKSKKEKAFKAEFEDDDELDSIIGLGSAKGGKRKKDDETTYRPKGGHSRSSKRKRDKDDPDGNKAGKKPKKSGIIPGDEEP